MKLTLAQTRKLKKQLVCLLGYCSHSFNSKTCPWVKIADAKDQETVQISAIISAIKDL